MQIVQANLRFTNNLFYGNRVEKLVIHNSGSDTSTVAGMHSDHQNRGWAGIGYHYIIETDGTVVQTRQDNIQGCHAGNANYNSVGICCIGNMNEHSLTTEQLSSLRWLVTRLQCKYNLSRGHVYKHSDFMATDCPGKKFPFAEIFSSSPNPIPGTPSGESEPSIKRYAQFDEYQPILVPLQEALNAQGYRDYDKCALIPNGFNGPRTASAVAKCPIYYGCKGKVTYCLQVILKEMGYYNGPTDGECGPGREFENAIIMYQKANGLVADGSFGPACWKALLG